MAVLEKKKSWRRPRSASNTKSAGKLTPEEQECTRVALKALAVRYGSFRAMGATCGFRGNSVARAVAGGSNVTAGMALVAARLAGVSVEDILSGDWPPPGACPYCGRTGEEG